MFNLVLLFTANYYIKPTHQETTASELLKKKKKTPVTKFYSVQSPSL